jgi:aldehyde dehydrogenase (NAD+)
VLARVVADTSSGGVTLNHAVLHLAVPDLPFGGVGASGMGAYHGKAGFDTFSHRKSVLTKPTRPDPALLYPPYTPTKRKIIRKLL